MACKVIDWTIQAVGGAAIAADYGFAAAYANAQYLRLADCPDEVHRNQIARLELKPYRNTVSERGANAFAPPLDEELGLARRPRFIVEALWRRPYARTQLLAIILRRSRAGL